MELHCSSWILVIRYCCFGRLPAWLFVGHQPDWLKTALLVQALRPSAPISQQDPAEQKRVFILIDVVVKDLNDCQGGKRGNIELPGNSKSSKALDEK